TATPSHDGSAAAIAQYPKITATTVAGLYLSTTSPTASSPRSAVRSEAGVRHGSSAPIASQMGRMTQSPAFVLGDHGLVWITRRLPEPPVAEVAEEQGTVWAPRDPAAPPDACDRCARWKHGAMAGGLVGLFDDIAALAKLAAASVDDVGLAAGRASVKAAGVVVDDTAVTPSYVHGRAAERELPIIRQIATGSLRNKLLFILPV